MPPRQLSRYASKGAFDLLAADDDDGQNDDFSDDGDEEQDIAPAPPASTPASSTKLTKTQQKKLAKEAREAKKAQKQANSNFPPTSGEASSVPSEGAASTITDVAAPSAERDSPVVEIPVQKVAAADDKATASAAPGPVPNGSAPMTKTANET